uniref:Protein kinase domain-containing protein n=2 Tax=Kalanchoe fedtschenkoi TaxID=63787 RepID=A0A7N0V4V1_KALFE
KVSYASNSFCQSDPGVLCDPQVMSLLEFLGDLNYPRRVVSSWSGNDPCGADWVGVDCNPDHKVSSISLPNFHLNGTLSPSVGKLNSLLQVRLESNNITGSIPTNWTTLPSLTVLDLSGNNIIPPLPAFKRTVKLLLTGNPMLNNNQPNTSSPQGNSSSPVNAAPSSEVPTTAGSTISNPSRESTGRNTFHPSTLVAIVIPVASAAVLICLLVPMFVFCYKKRRAAPLPVTSLVVHPRDPLDPDNSVKIAVADSTGNFSAGGSGSINNSRGGLHVIEAGNLVISVQVLRNVTKNFAPENELGRGGFGVVYKGELDDGTQIAVKRMESGVISNKALDEFHSEIAVLSKVRHRHLVSLLGYSVEGNERILVYEYMPQGALSRHLFHWKSMKLEPLSWKRRLNIGLDVARGMEYLHTLAHQSFIHRDLKSSNILLGDDFRAKVSDFGLVKLAPGEEKSVVTRLAGTFGYLAPEYAVTGKITTKADVFSFGVVLMELLTGMMALDEDRPEESQYLAAWFWQIKSDKEKLKAAIDPSLHPVEDMFPSIYAIADLAGHCTARDPNQRPDMGHAVNVLAPLVEKWKPFVGETEEYSGIDYSLPLNQMVKGWQESEGADFSYVDLDDSKSSIPARPTGFADSFTSADGR